MVTVNGEELALPELEKKDLPELLKKLKLSEKRVAVEINGRIIRKTDYPQILLNDSDTIEIIHFAGGG